MDPHELLPDELIVIRDALEMSGLPYAFGGAIALAFCGIPRYTQDIELISFLRSTNMMVSLTFFQRFSQSPIALGLNERSCTTPKHGYDGKKRQ